MCSIDKSRVDILDNLVKKYNPDYESEYVQAGGVITVYKEFKNGSSIISDIYVGFTNDEMRPDDMENIDYDLVENKRNGETFVIDGVTWTITDIYSDIVDYNNHLEPVVKYGTVIETHHDGIDVVYYIARKNEQVNNLPGIQITVEGTPLANALTENDKNYKAGSIVPVIACGVETKVNIKKVYLTPKCYYDKQKEEKEYTKTR